MKKLNRRMSAVLLLLVIIGILAVPVTVHSVRAAGEPTAVESETQAAETAQSSDGTKAIAAGICVGISAFGGAIAMGIAISKSAEGISRQPEAGGQIRTTLMLGLVFIETAIIYALIVAILVIFVL